VDIIGTPIAHPGEIAGVVLSLSSGCKTNRYRQTTEEHTETVRDTVRRKDVEVERTDNEATLREEHRR
jgi:hypothetical protein